jgi:hypothetical protein
MFLNLFRLAGLNWPGPFIQDAFFFDPDLN